MSINRAVPTKRQHADNQFISVLGEKDADSYANVEKHHASQRRNRFLEALKRIEDSVHYTPSNVFKAPYGYFRGRPVIGEQTVVNGGIYVSAAAHEAIVVDEKYGFLGQILEDLFKLSEKREKEGKSFKQGVLSDIARVVQQTLRFNPQGVNQLLEERKIGPDAKVSLDIFIEAKVGVARHQILLTAYLFEKLRKKGLLHGELVFDPGIQFEHAEDERLLYMNSVGKVFLVDPLKVHGQNIDPRTRAASKRAVAAKATPSAYEAVN